MYLIILSLYHQKTHLVMNSFSLNNALVVMLEFKWIESHHQTLFSGPDYSLASFIFPRQEVTIENPQKTRLGGAGRDSLTIEGRIIDER